MLELRKIDKYYNPGTVNEMCLFHQFDLKVEQGEFVSVVGSNGSGKTSMLNILCGSIGVDAVSYTHLEDGSVKSSFAKFMTEEQMDALVKAMGGEAGDLLLFAADKNKVVWDSLGALRVELAKQLELLDKNEYRFVWITEFPLFCLLYTSRCV